MPRLKAILLSLATLCAPAAALAQSANPAVPGTINYVEGSASIDGQPLNNQSVGTAVLQPGQTVETANGKVEVLLTPGVFLRLDDDSSVKMVSPSLTNTQVKLDRGRAALEVDEIRSQNNIQVLEANLAARVVKKGLYEFDSSSEMVRVYKGQAEVFEDHGDQAKPIKVKGDHQLASSAGVKPASFDAKSTEDDLYNWSSLRSQYLAEANATLASQYAGYEGFAPGWYWDPALWSYTWLPGAGMFWNPFGWGFYSPTYVYEFGPPAFHVYRGGYGWHGFHGEPIHGGFSGPRPGNVHPPVIAPRPGGFGGGFHGGMAGGFPGGRR